MTTGDGCTVNYGSNKLRSYNLFLRVRKITLECSIFLISQVQKSNLEGLLQRHVEMAAEIKNLDTDLQMLVYENYNKFISATDTIKR